MIGPMNRGYAFGFLIVLLVVLLGLYVAFTSFTSSREALRAQPVSASVTGVAQATRLSTGPSPTAIAALTLIPTAASEPVSPTATVSVSVPEPSLPPTEQAAPATLAPTEPPLLQPSDTPIPPSQPPTPIPVSSYPFRLAGPPAAVPDHPACCYILGTIRDAAGNSLEGIQVQAANAWNPPLVTVSKGGADQGNYDIPIGLDVVTWDIFLVDAGGNQISTKAQIQFDPKVANAFRVNWQRTY
jgi:hypothetical protein